jgi:hypothetical protein
MSAWIPAPPAESLPPIVSADKHRPELSIIDQPATNQASNDSLNQPWNRGTLSIIVLAYLQEQLALQRKINACSNLQPM